MFRYIACIFVFLLMFTGCRYDGDEIDDVPSRLVVEGWIDAGGFPVVMLTTSVPASKTLTTTDELQNHLLRWAKVTVSDGDTTVILTGKYDKRYYPSYIYTTGDLRGMEGKRYILTADYSSFHAKAITSILSPVRVDSFMVERCADNDTMCQVTAYITDDKSQSNYYNFFSCVIPDDSYYLASPLCAFSDSVMDSSAAVVINRGATIFSRNTFFHPIHKGIMIKFVQMDCVSYQFWNAYEKMITIARNPLFPIDKNISTNIEGGLGYWCGYGATEYYIPVSDLLKDKNKEMWIPKK